MKFLCDVHISYKSNSELIQIINENLPQISKLNNNTTFMIEINLNSVQFNFQKD